MTKDRDIMKREIKEGMGEYEREKNKKENKFDTRQYAQEIGIEEESVLDTLDAILETDATSLIITKCAKQSKTPNPTAELIRDVLQKCYEQGRITCTTPPNKEPIPPLNQDEVRQTLNPQGKRHMQEYYDTLIEQRDKYKKETKDPITTITFSDPEKIVSMDMSGKLEVLQHQVICEAVIRAYDIIRDGMILWYRPNNPDGTQQQHYSILTEVKINAIINRVYSTSRKPISRTDRNRIVDYMYTLIGENENDTIQWNKTPWIRPYKDATYDLLTNKQTTERTHTQDPGFPCKYNPNNFDDTIPKILEGMLGKDGLEGLCQILTDMLPTQRPNTQSGFYILGPAGSGKSTIAEFIRTVLNRRSKLVYSPRFEAVKEDKHMRAEISKARNIIVDEAQLDMNDDTQRAFFLQYTSKNTQSERMNYQDTHTVQTNASLLCLSTEPPKLDKSDTSRALWRRGKYIEIKQELETIDEDILGIMTNEKHIMGFINLCLKPAFRKIAKNKGKWIHDKLNPLENYYDRRDEQNNKVAMFLEEMDISYVAKDAEGSNAQYVTREALYELYRAYWTHHKEKADILTQENWKSEMTRLGFKLDGRRAKDKKNKTVTQYRIQTTQPIKMRGKAGYFNMDEIDFKVQTTLTTDATPQKEPKKPKAKHKTKDMTLKERIAYLKIEPDIEPIIRMLSDTTGTHSKETVIEQAVKVWLNKVQEPTNDTRQTIQARIKDLANWYIAKQDAN
ncbi:MAG: hypothetical protein F4Y18_02745 [Cenarchaeum sp. SB0663_bin_5]|nr:hypothetical protein [Cenarchaeum sp. SB0663_bin_5]MYL11500.1 hypothetical protein [Cenarchaeum sp. SB0669_bin_11]